MLAFRHYVRVRLLVVVFSLISSALAYAHPLGNDSITHFSVLYVKPDRLEVDLLLDIAETPSMFIRAEEIDLDKDDQDTEKEREAWLEKKAMEFESLLLAHLDGQRIPLKAVAETVNQKTGKKILAGKLIMKLSGYLGMPTYRLLIRYVGLYPQPPGAGEHTITYEDTTFLKNLGLKRILLEHTSGVEIMPPHPAFWDDRSDPFIYQQYDPASLPQENSAAITFRVLDSVSAAVVPEKTPRTLPVEEIVGDHETKVPPFVTRFTDPRNNPAQTKNSYRQADRLINLLQGPWSFMVILSVTVLSFAWGAAHALMPGHAKTVVAAYLISQRGTYWHAVFLAVIVTITHTALVVALGLVIWLYQKSHPTLGTQLQLWLGMVAGVLVAGMGFMLIWRALTGRLAGSHHHHHHDPRNDKRSWLKKLFTHSHPHLPTHTHDHHKEHTHTHEDSEHGVNTNGDKLTTRMLLILGITGGLVPCPTATIIMLLGIATNVVAEALYAIGIFSLGLALTLMLIGFVALSSRKVAARFLSNRQRERELTSSGQVLLLGIIPACSGLLVIFLGTAIATHYLYLILTGNRLFMWIG